MGESYYLIKKLKNLFTIKLKYDLIISELKKLIFDTKEKEKTHETSKLLAL